MVARRYPDCPLPTRCWTATRYWTHAGCRARLVGHSLGGWLALHYAATTDRCGGVVCLDGPAALDYSAMGLPPEHPGFVPDPPDVATDLRTLRCPGLLTLCRGTTADQAAWMVPFRQALYDDARTVPGLQVEWQDVGHMMLLTGPVQTAALVTDFAHR